MGRKVSELAKEWMKDPAFAREYDECAPDDLVIDPSTWRDNFDIADVIRADFKRAGLTRPRLFAMNETEEWADFRSCGRHLVCSCKGAHREDQRATRARRHRHYASLHQGRRALPRDAHWRSASGHPKRPLWGVWPAIGPVVSVNLLNPYVPMAPTAGLEPATRRLTAVCSTN
jgi:hypothetical protein